MIGKVFQLHSFRGACSSSAGKTASASSRMNDEAEKEEGLRREKRDYMKLLEK